MANWDDPNAAWDSGLFWDSPNVVVTGDVQPYLDLFTSEYNQQPNLIAAASVILQPLADVQAVMALMPLSYDLDVAVGAQLDAVGVWIGATRYLTTPLTGVYFSLDTVGQGFDQGTWFGPFDPTEGVLTLPDDGYRTLLRATIAANHWDGTIPDAYAVWDKVFPDGPAVFIIDNQDMTMYYGLADYSGSAVTKALFMDGYLDLRPDGVLIKGYIIPSGPLPFFALDLDTALFGGFDVGSWATISS